MTNNNGENETRQFGRVTGDNETRQFGAPQQGSSNQQPRQQSPQRPQQYFPEPGSQSPSGYGQSYQQQYEPVPSSYHVEEPKKGSGALAYVFAAIAAIAVVIAGVLFFLWRGAAEDANKPAPESVTQQYFPEPGSQSPSGYGQSYQQQYEPVPSSYHVEEPKKGSGALAYVFAAIAAIAVVIAGVLFFLWRGAAEDANKPAPESVTHTQTVTTEVPTTVTTTEDAPLDEFPTDLPTDLPPELQDQLDQGGDDLEDLLNELFGGLETNSGADSV